MCFDYRLRSYLPLCKAHDGSYYVASVQYNKAKQKTRKCVSFVLKKPNNKDIRLFIVFSIFIETKSPQRFCTLLLPYSLLLFTSKNRQIFEGKVNSEEIISKNRQVSVETCRFLVEHTGFEPVTSTLPVWRAPNCANAPYPYSINSIPHLSDNCNCFFQTFQNFFRGRIVFSQPMKIFADFERFVLKNRRRWCIII